MISWVLLDKMTTWSDCVIHWPIDQSVIIWWHIWYSWMTCPLDLSVGYILLVPRCCNLVTSLVRLDIVSTWSDCVIHCPSYQGVTIWWHLWVLLDNLSTWSVCLIHFPSDQRVIIWRYLWVLSVTCTSYPILPIHLTQNLWGKQLDCIIYMYMSLGFHRTY